VGVLGSGVVGGSFKTGGADKGSAGIGIGTLVVTLGSKVNSFGSYFSPTFSNLFKSSSKTDLLAITDLTISEGCTSFRSRSSSLCLSLNFSRVASNLARASPPEALSALEPDHFSYFSTSDRIRSSNEGLGGVMSLSLEFELRLGGRGGGDAGGGTCTGLGGLGFEILGLVTAGGGLDILSFWPLIPATETLPRFMTCAANRGRGSVRGPSRSLGILRGSLGVKCSGLSSTKGVPGLEPPTLSEPEWS
jgi:hypothetical protein